MSSMLNRIFEASRPVQQRLSGLLFKRNASFLNGTNANYIDDLYEVWKKDNNSVHKSWHLLFKAAENGVDLRQYYQPPPNTSSDSLISQKTATPTSLAGTALSIKENLAVSNLIASYQSRGHTHAHTDPFNGEFSNPRPKAPELSLAYWNLNESHLNKTYLLPKGTYIGNGRSEMTLGEIVSTLEEIYTKNIGFEFSHVDDNEQVEWLKNKIESTAQPLSDPIKIEQLERVTKASLFENFCAKKFPAEKRFGLEGCETMISGLSAIIDQSSLMGVDSFVLGMAHRGRLNVLSNICQQPPEHIFTRFNDELQMEQKGSSDVKYHLGVSNICKNPASGKDIRLTMVANPSHLEAVDPVTKGKTKAEQVMRKDDGSKVACILIHGDAAYSGQGIVFETMQLGDLPSYTVYGTIHVVSNNQIGFTTEPHCSRSSRYCTDIAKAVAAPVFHVNADDPEAVLRVCTIATEFRNTFKSDVVIDIVGYRRNGHNEGDNPHFTQPLLYKAIASKPSVMQLYSKQLIDSKVISDKDFHKMVKNYDDLLVSEFSKAQNSKMVLNNVWIDSPWKDFFKKVTNYEVVPTGVALEEAVNHQRKCCQLPKDFTVHPAIKRVMSGRMEMLEAGVMDWAMAEIAAFASLLVEGHHVRLSGQDAERGTFSHRHHVLHDVSDQNKVYKPLAHIHPNQAEYSVSNSSLSEYGVLGFEHGYSISNPHSLTIWEAQFGDFANTAQCIIDQFISSGEDKWIRQSGQVLLLPHGFDGMGPEHSSARLERFLQLTREDPDTVPDYAPQEYEVRQIENSNYIVAFPSTPANIFHLLRRQLTFNFRKPLVVMSPKNLLRHELARSNFSEIGPNTSFQRVISENGVASQKAKDVKRLIFCSGKIYYELFQARNGKKLDASVAIARIEQLSPFPFDLVYKEILKYKNAEVYFVQEEPKNQGAFYYVQPMINNVAGSRKVHYCGRCVSASPATGSKFQHNKEQKLVIDEALDI